MHQATRQPKRSCHAPLYKRARTKPVQKPQKRARTAQDAEAVPCSAMPGTGPWMVCIALVGAINPRSPLIPDRKKLRHDVPTVRATSQQEFGKYKRRPDVRRDVHWLDGKIGWTRTERILVLKMLHELSQHKTKEGTIACT